MSLLRNRVFSTIGIFSNGANYDSHLHTGLPCCCGTIDVLLALAVSYLLAQIARPR